MQFAKLLFLFSARTIRWLIRLPKSTVNWLLTKAMDYSLKHPALKSWAKTWLHNCPSLDARLRRLAAARGFVVKAPETQFMANQAVSESNEFTASTEDFPNLTPGARRSYGELKNAIEERKKENS